MYIQGTRNQYPVQGIPVTPQWIPYEMGENSYELEIQK